MKKSILLAALFLFSMGTMEGQESGTNYEANAQTVDSIVKSIYSVISGEEGEKRDWALMRYIFHPEANMVGNYIGEDGKKQIIFLSPEEYIKTYSESMESRDLFENEVQREIQTFGNMVHVLSTFRTFRKKDDSEPFKEGISSIQLFHDGNRWWVVNMYWKNATPDTPIPLEYVPE